MGDRVSSHALQAPPVLMRVTSNVGPPGGSDSPQTAPTKFAFLKNVLVGRLREPSQVFK